MTLGQESELLRLLEVFSNAAFDCGDFGDSVDPPSIAAYDELCIKAGAAKAAVVEFVKQLP